MAEARYSRLPTEPVDLEMEPLFDYSSPFQYNSDDQFDQESYKSVYTYTKSREQSGVFASECEDTARRSIGIRLFVGFIILLSYILMAMTGPITVWFCVKTLKQWERMVVFRLGELHGVKGPGLVLIIPWLDRWVKIDLRMRAFSVPPQQLITNDGGIIEVGADVQYRIRDAVTTVVSLCDPEVSLRSLGLTVLVRILMTWNESTIEKDKREIVESVQTELNKQTQQWGLEISRVELCGLRTLKSAEPHSNLGPVLRHIGLPGVGKDEEMMDLMEKINTRVTSSDRNKPSAKMSSKIGKQLAAAVLADRTQLDDQPMGVIRLEVVGDGGGVFWLVFENGQKQLYDDGDVDLQPNVSVILDVSDFQQVLDGQLSPLQAYIAGRLKLHGDTKLLSHLERMAHTSSNNIGAFTV